MEKPTFDDVVSSIVDQICDGVDATNAAMGKRVCDYPPTLTIIDDQGGMHLIEINRTPPPLKQRADG